MALERVKGGCHRNNLLVVWGFGSPESFGLQPIELAFCGHHEGLVSDVGEFTVKLILMQLADIQLEVVAWNHEVSIEQNANGVVSGYVEKTCLRTLST